MSLIVRTDGRDATTLTLNRPEKLNAVNRAMLAELQTHLTEIAAADSVGLLIVRGAGTCFSVGLDLNDVAAPGQEMTPLEMAGIVDQLANLPQPVIAAVHGHCFTGALEIALAADIIVAAESAQFADTHAKWGLTPAWGMSQRLPRRVGRGSASRMMFTCATVGAVEALTMGLADVLMPASGFDVALADFSASISANSWFSHRANKELMAATDGMPLHAGLAYEFVHRPGRAPDFADRVARFQKRRNDTAR